MRGSPASSPIHGHTSASSPLISRLRRQLLPQGRSLFQQESISRCKILVISDVHGRLRDLRWVLQNETADAMFYLGDGLYDLNAALELRREPVPYPIYRVAGNCDVNYSEPSEGLAPFGGVLFFYTHGHHYGVKMGSERLAECAGERGADVALFGHTHRRELVRGVGTAATVFNPGSLRDGGSYGVITIENGKCSFTWKRVPEF